jgi:hypothetical protein
MRIFVNFGHRFFTYFQHIRFEGPLYDGMFTDFLLAKVFRIIKNLIFLFKFNFKFSSIYFVTFRFYTFWLREKVLPYYYLHKLGQKKYSQIEKYMK